MIWIIQVTIISIKLVLNNLLLSCIDLDLNNLMYYYCWAIGVLFLKCVWTTIERANLQLLLVSRV